MEMEITEVLSFWTNVTFHFITWLFIFVIWRYVKVKDEIAACPDVVRTVDSIPTAAQSLDAWAESQIKQQQQEIERKLMNAVIQQESCVKVTKPVPPRVKRKYVKTAGGKNAVK